MDILAFVIARLVTRRFWYLVIASFIGVIMMGWRSNLRNKMFEEAAETVGKRFGY